MSPRGKPPETRAAWAERLQLRGLLPSAADRAAAGAVRAVESLRAAAGEPEFAFFVPGRIEVLGKHTDYAGGRSLLAAAEEGFVLVGRRESSAEIHIVDAVDGRSAHLGLQSSHSDPVSGWAIYPDCVVRRIARDFPGVTGGATLAFSNSLPRSAGMSSSSAFIVAVFLGAAEALDLHERPDFGNAFGAGLDGGRDARERLADYLGAVEAGRSFEGLGRADAVQGVGTDGGSQDHVAVLCGSPGHLVRYAFGPTRFEGALALPEGWLFAVAASGVRAKKTGAAQDAYNRLAGDARRIATLWRGATGSGEPHLGAILAQGPDTAVRLEGVLATADETGLSSRLRQFATEANDLVPSAAEALEVGDLARFGAAVARSQSLAERVLRNGVPETTALVQLALQQGAPAASQFGAGFGGAVWALVRSNTAEPFLEAWRSHYLARFPDKADRSRFFVARPGPAAFRVL